MVAAGWARHRRLLRVLEIRQPARSASRSRVRIIVLVEGGERRSEATLPLSWWWC
jgi:hypothetical protein